MSPRSKPTIREKGNRPVKGLKVGWREAISNELDKAERLFVLGIGNRRKGDDAAGSLCVRLLTRKLITKKRRADAPSLEPGRPRASLRESPPLELRIFDAGESPESATGLIREFRPTHVVIIDAATGEFPAGTIFLVDKKKIRHEDVSTHRLPLSLLIRYLEESIVCRTIPVGIEPKEVAWGKPVSRIVRASAARLSDWLAETLMARRA